MRRLTLALLCCASTTWAAEPSVGVLVGRSTGLPAARSKELAALASRALLQSGVPVVAERELERRIASLGVKDPSVCGGVGACLTQLIGTLGLSHAVVLSFTAAGTDVAVAAEVVDSTGARRAQWGAVLAADSAVPVEELFVALAEKVKAVMPAPAPVEPRTVETAPPATVEAAPAPATSRIGRFLLGIALGCAVVGAALAGVGFATYTELRNGADLGGGLKGSTLTLGVAQQQLQTSNVLLGVGGAVGVLALGFAVGAVVAWCACAVPRSRASRSRSVACRSPPTCATAATPTAAAPWQAPCATARTAALRPS